MCARPRAASIWGPGAERQKGLPEPLPTWHLCVEGQWDAGTRLLGCASRQTDTRDGGYRGGSCSMGSSSALFSVGVTPTDRDAMAVTVSASSFSHFCASSSA